MPATPDQCRVTPELIIVVVTGILIVAERANAWKREKLNHRLLIEASLPANNIVLHRTKALEF